MVDAAISHPCAQSGWGGSSYWGSFWRSGSGQKTTEGVVVDRRGGDGGVLRWVPRRVVDGVADSIWVLIEKGGLLGFGSVDVFRSGRLIGFFWVLRLTGRWAWKGRMALLSTADVGWILLVLVWIQSVPFGWGYGDWSTPIWGSWVSVLGRVLVCFLFMYFVFLVFGWSMVVAFDFLAAFRRRCGGCGCLTFGFVACKWGFGVDLSGSTLGFGWGLFGSREQWCSFFFWVEVRLQFRFGVGGPASALSSPTFVVFPFCLTALFLFLIWFSFCLPISFEIGTYHSSIFTAFQLTDVYTCLMIWVVWIIEQLGEFVYLVIVNAVLLSVHCLWIEAIMWLQIELYQLMVLCNLSGMFSVLYLGLGLMSPPLLYTFRGIK